MAGFTCRLGYRSVILRQPGCTKPCRRMLHRLVALAFCGAPGDATDVMHLDGNPRNNRADNLRWGTHAENQAMMRTHKSAPWGERSASARLTADDVRTIRAACANGARGIKRRLAEQYGMSPAQITRIARGERWAHI